MFFFCGPLISACGERRKHFFPFKNKQILTRGNFLSVEMEGKVLRARIFPKKTPGLFCGGGISPTGAVPSLGYFPYSEERTRKVCSKRLRFPHVPIPIGTHLHLTKMAPKKVLIFKQVEMAGIEPACKGALYVSTKCSLLYFLSRASSETDQMLADRFP